MESESKILLMRSNKLGSPNSVTMISKRVDRIDMNFLNNSRLVIEQDIEQVHREGRHFSRRVVKDPVLIRLMLVRMGMQLKQI